MDDYLIRAFLYLIGTIYFTMQEKHLYKTKKECYNRYAKLIK